MPVPLIGASFLQRLSVRRVANPKKTTAKKEKRIGKL
jgi:hypothetical protein